MSSIRTYEELLTERKRLDNNLVLHKAAINAELMNIKERFEPLTQVVSWLGIFKNKTAGTGGSLLKMGAEAGIDLLVGQSMLSKVNWLAKLVIPFILKKVTAKAIEKK